MDTDDPQRLLGLRRVHLGDDHVPFDVTNVRLFKGQALVSLAGVEDRDAAEEWRGSRVYVRATDAVPLGEDEYYYHQLVDLRVITVEGEALGRITGVVATGANDVYVVEGDRGEVLIPAIRDVVLGIDLAAGTVTVKLPEGLL